MKTWQGTLLRTSCIAAVVIAGAWHANDPESHGWPLAIFTSGGAATDSLSEYCITQVGWSADGRMLLSLSRGGRDASPRLAMHDINHKSTHTTIDAIDEWIRSAVLAPDGRHVLVGSNQGRLLWLATDTSGTPLPLVEPSIAPAFFTATAIASDGRQVAAGTNIGTIFAGDLELKTALTLTSSRTSSIVALCFSNDDKRLLSAQGNGHISIWELATGERLQEFVGSAGSSQAGAFLSDGNRVISGGLDDTVRIWDVFTGHEMWRGEFGLFGITALAVSADGLTAAWAGHGRRIILWDVVQGQKIGNLVTPASVVLQLRFSPDGALLAAAGSGGLIHLYDVLTGREQEGIAIDGRCETYPEER